MFMPRIPSWETSISSKAWGIPAASIPSSPQRDFKLLPCRCCVTKLSWQQSPRGRKAPGPCPLGARLPWCSQPPGSALSDSLFTYPVPGVLTHHLNSLVFLALPGIPVHSQAMLSPSSFLTAQPLPSPLPPAQSAAAGPPLGHRGCAVAGFPSLLWGGGESGADGKPAAPSALLSLTWSSFLTSKASVINSICKVQKE